MGKKPKNETASRLTIRGMATKSSAPVAPKKGWLARLGFHRRAWEKENIAPAAQITQADTALYGAGVTTAAALLGQFPFVARNRQLIYEKWMRMECDPIIASAVQLLVTAALGGHETTGDLIFIEKKPEAQKDPSLGKIVEEISEDLAPLFNRVAFPLCYTGAVYGDAYARVYSEKGKGVVDLYSDELVRPQLVQPFEQAGRTIGFAVSVGERNFELLNVMQMARLRMPRTQWIPQFGVVEKSLRIGITNDEIDKAPVMPAMVGGSLLYNAERPYDNLIAALTGLVGQRFMDSIDEQIVTVNMQNTTDEQRARIFNSLRQMLERSKQISERSVKTGWPVLERIRHLIPIFNDKQLTSITPMGNGAGRGTAISIDDIMLHARLLAGALGVDLSMIGFADQMSGGLGEGGFFRVSAQTAERARVLRVAVEDFFNQVINIHTLMRYGVVFDEGERPWDVNFFASLSALESERQRTRADAMNAGAILVQTIQQLKDMGASKEIMQEYLTKTMQVDEDQAKLYAQIVEAKPPENEGGGEGGM